MGEHTSTHVKHVAVLGAGIMGSATGLFLARRGVRVTLFDKADQPFARASRWNEGKIHLGFLYSADPSLETARRVLPGGLAFRPLTEELIGCPLEGAVTPSDDTYIVHRESVTNVDMTERYFRAVAALVADHPAAGEYLTPIANARPWRLTRTELDANYDGAWVTAGFRVAERSVSTCWVADRFAAALAAEQRIEQRMNTPVLGVRGSNEALVPPLFVHTPAGLEGPFSHVVNALWEGRLAIDTQLGLPKPAVWSHRFRLSAFVRTGVPSDIPSTDIATGPFGDVKNYNHRDFYLSWYLSGLRTEGTDVEPPAVPSLEPSERMRLAEEIFSRLAIVIRPIRALRALVESIQLQGGWVYAAGRGSLADPSSTIHRRDRIGISHAGAYISIDTGKY